MLEARALCKDFRLPSGKGTFRAVDHVSFTLRKGETYALVGESGSGKSTLSRLLMGLIPLTEGDVLLDGKSLFSMTPSQSRLRFTQIQMILQDGKSALDPRFTVYGSIAEPLRNLLGLSPAEERERVETLMRQMELPLTLLSRHAGELSAGQQKRVCIARAVSVSPRLIILDEAVSGLDVILRKTVLDLLADLQRKNGYTYLLITHDIDAALYLADHIMVMKGGAIVESVRYNGNTDCFIHPYSRLLLETMLPLQEAHAPVLPLKSVI